MNRRAFLTSAATLVVGAISASMIPAEALAQNTPSAATIERQLSARPRTQIAPQNRVSRREFVKRPELRRVAPSIDIQTINFEFGSARIPRDQQWKVQRIAEAMRAILRRNRNEMFLVEGHTDAVGSNYSNQILSEQRAASLASLLTRFGVPSRALETVGYGETDLLVWTQAPEWRNRRVTLRRITEFVTPY